MPYIIKKSSKQVTCNECHSVIGYEHKNIRYDEEHVPSWFSDHYRIHNISYIVCPDCGNRIILTREKTNRVTD